MDLLFSSRRINLFFITTSNTVYNMKIKNWSWRYKIRVSLLSRIKIMWEKLFTTYIYLLLGLQSVWRNWLPQRFVWWFAFVLFVSGFQREGLSPIPRRPHSLRKLFELGYSSGRQKTNYFGASCSPWSWTFAGFSSSSCVVVSSFLEIPLNLTTVAPRSSSPN